MTTKKKVLVISPVRSAPATSGQMARISRFISAFKLFDQEIHFAFVPIYDNRGSDEATAQQWEGRYYKMPFNFSPKVKSQIQKCREKNFLMKLRSRLCDSFKFRDPLYTYKIDDWYCQETEIALRNLAQTINPDLVVVEYVYLSWALKIFDDQVFKLIDTHDVFADKSKMYPLKSKPIQTFSTPPSEEIKGLSRADVVIAIQDKEREYFSRFLNNNKTTVLTVGHFIEINQPIIDKINNYKILFIASPTPVNLEGFKYFINNILPLVQQQFNQSQFILAGAICDKIDDDESCTKLGVVENLNEIYNMADVVINPVLRGTGLAIKSIEALGYARPLVATIPAGTRGLEQGIGKALLASDTPEGFADAIISIFRDENLRNQLSKNAYEFAQEWNKKSLKSLEKVIM
ncbi:glycosyl transferase group 1 [Gloeothece citriformis PCC 7424]|uniref:Glycosyl transferase group 1 n=1 Tax=Gloeothece citriformis (strain PCC 7424) TaxID=65393 RepID=B7KK32_GLOC7|nr:glycosyltransferase [Gloeothece citriformis]ACK70917.1 glycosyl transferase group 1 [Gloeothece citriformis PCC 7424]